MKNPVKLVIVDDNELFTDGLKFNLLSNEKCNVIGECSSIKGILPTIKTKRPDIAFIQMVDNSSIFYSELTEIKNSHNGTKMIIISDSYDIEITKLLQAGVSALLFKRSPREEFIQALNDIVLGKIYISPLIRPTSSNVNLLPTVSGISSFKETLLAEFTIKELNIIYLICKEFSSKEIAHETTFSIRTIEGIRRRIMKKMKVKNCAGLIAYALKKNVLKLYEDY
jgi:DNA-binding NarL/FixJ family response regulator